jgi:phage portal protein BeeE
VRLSVDLDRVAALSDERDALWDRVAGADFLSAEEKRGMLGVGGEGVSPFSRSP